MPKAAAIREEHRDSMATTLAIFSVLVVVMSLYGAIWPRQILRFARLFMVSPGNGCGISARPIAEVRSAPACALAHIRHVGITPSG